LAEEGSQIDEQIRWARAVFARHDWSLNDLDYLVYEGQSEDPGNGDPDFDLALELLSRLRERGVPIR